tara:strand:+ start:99 stop:332 length:234 start_codon:yes stop_codon:yes gene_type:complete
MRNLIEKQILDWRQELDKQIKIRDNAKKVFTETDRTILMIEGGLQAKEQLLKKLDSESQALHKEGKDQGSKIAPSNS